MSDPWGTSSASDGAGTGPKRPRRPADPAEPKTPADAHDPAAALDPAEPTVEAAEAGTGTGTDTGAGTDHGLDRASRPVRRPREPEPLPDWLRSTPYADATPPPGRDPVAVAAVTCGFIGIVLAGLLMAIVTAVLAGQAGIRARESGRSFELPYLAFVLAFVDAAVWIVVHVTLYVPAWIG